MYESRFYNLDSFSLEWRAEEFRFAVEALETMPLDQLRALAAKLGLVFSDTPLQEVEDEAIIDAILTDYPKEVLLENLNYS